MRHPIIIALLGFAFTAAAAEPTAPQAGWLKDPSTRCQFVAPRSMPSGPTFRIGECLGGKASGLGVMLRRDGSVAGEAFYGSLKDGVPVLGVLDTRRNDEGGFMYGRWKGGDLVTDDENPWPDRFESLTTGAKAARAASALFKSQNNEASARFYARQAAILEEQIDG